MKTYDFIVKFLPDEAKQTYSRETYRRLVSSNDEYFVANIKNDKPLSLRLAAGETTVIDRFLFMYLAGKMHDELDAADYQELAPVIYMMRAVSMPLKLDAKAENEVVMHPDYSQWAMNDEGTDGKQVFRETWNIIPQKYKDWIQNVFASIPKDLESLVAAQSPDDDIIIAA